MDAKHSLLRRQLKRHFGAQASQLPASTQAFLEAVDEAYAGFDSDREMLERSLDLSSQELLQATAEMRAMFQALPDLLLRLDREGTVLTVKAGVNDDLTMQRLVGKKIQSIDSGEAGGRFNRAIIQAAGTKTIVAIEYSLATPGGANDYEARLVPTLDDQIVVVIRNITERKRTEQVLRSTRQQLERLMSKSPTVIYSLSVAGKTMTPMYISANVTAMLGYEPNEVLRGHWWRERVHSDDIARVESEMGKLFELDHASHDYRFRHRDGTYHWLRDEQRLLRDQNQRPVEIVGSWMDVTERMELEGQLRQAQKMEAIGRLAGGVAHDFNNLLTVIKGYSQLLLTETMGIPEQRELLREIFAASNRAGRLTHQLLAFSRKQAMQLQPTDMNVVVADLVKMLQRVIGEDISLVLDYAPELPLVQADVGMLEQVLVNLAVNARDAMPDGGQLFIRTSQVSLPRTAGYEHVSLQPGEYVQVSVRDTGCGMTSETMARLFEPFFTTKEVGKGTGLGLATVYGIIQQHQGTVDVQSEVGKGSIFRVFLRATGRSQTAVTGSVDVSRPAGGSETILLVEDERSVRQFARMVLQRAGYRVYEAGSAPAALEVWHEHKAEIQLVLTDIILPDGPSGMKLAETLRAERPDLRIVFVSGYAAPSLSPHLQVGLNFLPKPYLPNALTKLIRDCLDAPSPRGA